ncbi:fumarylacetoacetate hydrolase family protein [Paenibacillus turpanensis]|uniref:fumarylacetoacetate hydrolase family protein n=1 Tax=Paenibacillus turpanensis TaxID=2689078 RepID=UPI00140C0AB0|nr:fumarylacetoacetate hydrolase family protein [Paenibacillus turpanensis]
MSQQVRNVFCVGRNYKLHAEELGNDIPTEPMIFSKPTHALVPMNGGTVQLPAGVGGIHYEAEVVIRIGKRYEAGASANDVIDAIALGIDFTLRDVQSELKKQGYPWLAAKGFRNSAPITAFHPFPGLETLQSSTFSLLKNGEAVQLGDTSLMIFPFQRIVEHVGGIYGLDEGDIIYTGTPAGVGATEDGDHFEIRFGEEAWGTCTARIG